MSKIRESPSEKRKQKGNVGNCLIIVPTSKTLEGESQEIFKMTTSSSSKLTEKEQLDQQEAEEQSLQNQVSSFYNSISSSQPKELTSERGGFNRLGAGNYNESQFTRSNKLIQYKTICIKSNDRIDNNRDLTIDRLNRCDIDKGNRYASDDNHDDDENDEDDDDEDDDDDDDDEDDDEENESDSNESDFSNLSGLSDLSGQEWKPITKSITWVQRQINSGINPRDILSQFLSNGTTISANLNDMSLWRILTTMLAEPPRRQKLQSINTINDVVRLLKESKNIIVLTGAGVSVSCGIPDFRSSDGIYSRLAKDFPDLPDPQAMFDINYFSRDPRPFYKFAREIYPGQFIPSPCHRFIKLLEKKGKLLRNYTQNIDTLEQVAGIKNVIECHGSFATASCTRCKYKTTADEIREDIFTQKIPLCPKCHPCDENRGSIEQSRDRDRDRDRESLSELVQSGIMKPDIVFFGEGLPDAFHAAMASDKDKCDLLIVIGSSLKVRPVALIPSSIPAYVPQILINREQLNHLEFDVELLGDSDIIINQLCHTLGDDWTEICWQSTLTESKYLKTTPTAGCGDANVSAIDTDSQSTKSAITTNSSSCGIFCDSGFESSSSLHASSSSGPAMSNLSTAASSSESYAEKLGSIILESTRQKHQRIVKIEKSVVAAAAAAANVRHFSVDSSKDSGICESSNSNMPPSSADFYVGQDDDDEATIGNIDDPETDVEDYRVVNRKISRSSPSTSYLSLGKPVSVAEKLPENCYYHNSATCAYVFPGAQVYWTSSDSEFDEEEDDVDEGEAEDSDYKRGHFLPANHRAEEAFCGGGAPANPASSTSSTKSSAVVAVDNFHQHHHHLHQHRSSESDDSPPIKRRKDSISALHLDG